MDLEPRLLHKVIAWAVAQESVAEKTGSPLLGEYLEAARRVGVRQPDLIRHVSVERVPLPDDPELRKMALQAGFLGPTTIGLTLGYAIFIVRGNNNVRVISHECRHVYQYEQYGSIDNFLPAYLGQVAACGYRDAPLEVDARDHEIQAI